MRKNTQDGRRQDFIETEPDECAQPSPEQKLQLVKDKKRYEHGTEQADDSTGDSAIGDDGANDRRERGNQSLNDEIDDGVVRVHHCFRHTGAFSCLCLAERVLNCRDAVVANYGDEILRAAVDEAAEGLADPWDAAVVEPHEGISEGNEHEKAEELPDLETGT